MFLMVIIMTSVLTGSSLSHEFMYIFHWLIMSRLSLCLVYLGDLDIYTLIQPPLVCKLPYTDVTISKKFIHVINVEQCHSSSNYCTSIVTHWVSNISKNDLLDCYLNTCTQYTVFWVISRRSEHMVVRLPTHCYTSAIIIDKQGWRAINAVYG